jgi:hypothetical protein
MRDGRLLDRRLPQQSYLEYDTSVLRHLKTCLFRVLRELYAYDKGSKSLKWEVVLGIFLQRSV